MTSFIKPEKICDSLNCRHTKLRMSLGHILHHAKSPLSVAQITDLLKKDNIKVNKTTIYRELDFLVKNGILNEIQFDDNFKRYEYNSNNQKSYLICNSCGDILPVEIDRQTVDIELDKISKLHDFIINRHSLVFFGNCQKCH